MLNRAENLRNKNWCPWEPLEDYAEEIRGSYDLCGNLLIECFRVLRETVRGLEAVSIEDEMLRCRENRIISRKWKFFT